MICCWCGWDLPPTSVWLQKMWMGSPCLGFGLGWGCAHHVMDLLLLALLQLAYNNITPRNLYKFIGEQQWTCQQRGSMPMYDVVASLCKVAELPHPLETPVLKVWWKCKVCVCVSLLGMCLVCLKICWGVTAAGIKDVAAKRGLGGPVAQMSGMALELRKTAGHFVQSGLQE